MYYPLGKNRKIVHMNNKEIKTMEDERRESVLKYLKSVIRTAAICGVILILSILVPVPAEMKAVFQAVAVIGVAVFAVLYWNLSLSKLQNVPAQKKAERLDRWIRRQGYRPVKSEEKSISSLIPDLSPTKDQVMGHLSLLKISTNKPVDVIVRYSKEEGYIIQEIEESATRENVFLS